MFSTRTEKQTKVVEDQVKLLESRMKLSESRTISLGDQFASMMEVSLNSTQAQVMSALDQVDNKSHSMLRFADEMSVLTKDLYEQLIMSKLTLYSNIIITMMIRVLIVIEDLDSHFIQIINDYENVHDTVTAKQFPYDQISNSNIEKTLIQAKKLLPIDMSLVPYDNTQTLVANLGCSGYLKKPYFIIIDDIPIIDNASHMSLWHIQTLPKFTEAGWMKSVTHHPFIVKNTQSNQWSELTNVDFAECIANPLRICPHQLTWKSQTITSCETS